MATSSGWLRLAAKKMTESPTLKSIPLPGLPSHRVASRRICGFFVLCEDDDECGGSSFFTCCMRCCSCVWMFWALSNAAWREACTLSIAASRSETAWGVLDEALLSSGSLSAFVEGQLDCDLGKSGCLRE